MTTDAIRYPIGSFAPKDQLTPVDRDLLSSEVLQIVPSLRTLTRGLTSDQLRTPYRNGGWTIQQIIHHMADNDMNAYFRFKRALTENEPIATSYREDLFADLPDYPDTDIDTSLALMEALHRRFYTLLLKLEASQFARTLRTEALGRLTLDTALQRFVWHDRHHAAQIESFLARRGWRPGQ